MELASPILEWQGAVPQASDFQDVYYSRMDGLAEARHVFLQGNGLPERLMESLTIAETGFGTGLNFLALWQMWRIYHEKREILLTAQGAARSEGVWGSIPHLHYITTELHPLAAADMARALSAWPELEPLTKQLLAVYPPAIKGAHRRYLEGGRITIDFLFGDATEMLTRYQQDAGEIIVDAWFLDGFAPAKNQSLWSADLYQAMAKLSHEGTTLASFTAAGDVRRGLQEAGFSLQKVQGFAHKREMIIGKMNGAAAPNPTLRAAPCAEFKRPVLTAIIIGAGIAGIASAWRLAQQGYQVMILEASDAICTGASGNPASALTPYYPAKWNQRGRMLAAGFHAMRHWIALLRDKGHGIRGMQDGMLMLHLDDDSPRSNRLAAAQQSLNLPSEYRRMVNAAEASALAGVDVAQGGWYYPMGGWLQMGDFCQALLDDAGEKIEILFGQKVTALQHDNGWKVNVGNQKLSAETVVIANASAASALLPDIKLEPVHGQMLCFEAPQEWQKLRMPLHAGHVLIPLKEKLYWGASFRHHLNSNAVLPEETEKLLRDLKGAFPDLYAALESEALLRARRGAISAGEAEGDGGKAPNHINIMPWAGIRCTHPSRMPLIGAVKSQPKGLYLNLAYGARGAVSAAIAFDGEMYI